MVNSFFSRLVDPSIEDLKRRESCREKKLPALTPVPDGVKFEKNSTARQTNSPSARLRTPIQVQEMPSAFHPHAQRNGSHRHGVRLQSRLFARWNQSLRRSLNSNPLC
jgi:hypothetical protein